ncbi:class E sortase, partial [Streptomyces sp. SID7982]|nr:class E sortase [Streptomyces sp. SID7982]
MSVRLVVRTFSELCITVGALIVLFVVYFLFWTGVKAADAAEGEIDTLQSRWAHEPVTPAPPPPSASAEPSAPAPYRDGKPFATMHIPRFGSGWEWPVLENTQVKTLQKGLGHYSGT